MLDISPVIDEALVEMLHARGERLTPQRLLVLETVRQDGGHLTADTIHARVAARYPYINRATIYRTLTWLTEQGLTCITDLGTGHAEYQYLAREHHHHLVCLTCGERQEFPNALVAPLATAIRAQYGFAPRLDHLAVFGLCRRCQEVEATEAVAMEETSARGA